MVATDMLTLVYKHTVSVAECMMISSEPLIHHEFKFTHNVITFYRLILIAEKDTVYQKFPTPLINRLEKHFVLTSSVLEDWQSELLKGFERWISQFCEARY